MAISNLFSNDIYPNLRSYTILVVSLITGVLLTFNFFGGNNKSKTNEENEELAANGQNQYVWVHSTTEMWQKCPVFVQEGQALSILVSGTYTNNVQSLVQGNRSQHILTADGKTKNGVDSLHLSMLIDKKAQFGQLLFQVVSKNNRPTPLPDPENIYHVHDGLNEYYVEKDGYLYFTTNQPSFHPYGRKQTTLFNTVTGDSVSIIKLKSEKYEPFFEDNFGNLYMQIRLKD